MMQIKSITSSLSEDIKFLKGWVTSPAAVGAIKPTGKFASKSMAEAVPLKENYPVLELGPGTGAITRELLRRGFPAKNIYSIEYSEDFYNLLTTKYPGVNFIRGDAFDLDDSLSDFPDQKFSGVIGAVPLLNVTKPQRIQIIVDALDRVVGNGPFVQISYGAKPPVDSIDGKFQVKKLDRIFRNIPPAGLWVYRKCQET